MKKSNVNALKAHHRQNALIARRARSKASRKASGAPRLTPAVIERALRATGGFISQAAILLHTTQSLISHWIKKNERLRVVVSEIEDEHLDLAESKLVLSLKKREPWAIQFYLKYKGKKRGYVESNNIDMPRVPIVFKYDSSEADKCDARKRADVLKLASSENNQTKEREA